MNVAETCFHHFEENISSDVLPERFTYPFCYKPHPLVEEAARIVVRDLSSFPAWKEEVGRGKMFGVLVVADGKGRIGFIAAYSGNIAHNTDYSYFVPPVYDVLSPDGFFRKEELEISRINEKISELELSESFRLARERLESVRKEAACEISSYAEMMKEAKKRRDAARGSGIDDAARERLLSESQYQKAELKRMKRRWDAIVGDAEADAAVFTRQIEALRRERKERSVALQRRVFEKFDFLNARGEVRNVCDIFEEARHELPPAGAGECAAPRLLQFAYVHGYRPLAMGEFWLGESPEGEIRKHGQFYPSCKSKCEPILKFMLQGLDVEASPLEVAHCGEQDLSTVYEDDAIWVVDKPAGMLSVPGKTRQDSVSDIACRKFSPEARPLVVHRHGRQVGKGQAQEAILPAADARRGRGRHAPAHRPVPAQGGQGGSRVRIDTFRPAETARSTVRGRIPQQRHTQGAARPPYLRLHREQPAMARRQHGRLRQLPRGVHDAPYQVPRLLPQP